MLVTNEDKKLVFNYFNNIELETNLKNFINEETKREKLLSEEFKYNIFILSEDVRNISNRLIIVTNKIKKLKKEINTKFTKEEYRIIAKKYM